MTSILARSLHAAAILALLAVPAAHAQAPALPPVPIEAFFSNPLLEDVTLSPSGRYLAAVSAAPGRRDALVVLDWRIHGMPLLVGDQVKDAAQLKATSPIEQAARITQPVLMAYGASDRRVPLYHGNKFRDAVASHNKGVEWVVYPEEGHGWSQLSTRVDFWGRVEKFLDKHIGAAR